MNFTAKKERILSEINNLSPKDLLSSLKSSHATYEETAFLDQTIHSTGTPSISDRKVTSKLIDAFKEADKLFLQLSKH